jgi:GNAT superfamily N-acetyltransferase
MADNLRAIFHGGLRVEPPLLKYREQPRFLVASKDLVLCASGLTPNLDLCYATVLGPITSAEFFAHANAFFRDEQPYKVILEAGVSDALGATLREQGWRVDADMPDMVLAPLPTTFPPPPPDLTIKCVETEMELDAYLTTFNPHAPEPSLAAATDPGVAILLGFSEGRLVARGRLACHGAVAYNVGLVTLPAHRGKGYGTALTWAVIAEGVRRGCTSAMLSASAMGYSLYERMGFQTVSSSCWYLPPNASVV